MTVPAVGLARARRGAVRGENIKSITPRKARDVALGGANEIVGGSDPWREPAELCRRVSASLCMEA